jgi:hypothetical protein
MRSTEQASEHAQFIYNFIYIKKNMLESFFCRAFTRGVKTLENQTAPFHMAAEQTHASVLGTVASNGVRLIRCHEPPDQQRFAAGVPTKAVAGETRRELPFRHRHSRAARARAPLTGASSPSAFFARHTHHGTDGNDVRRWILWSSTSFNTKESQKGLKTGFRFLNLSSTTI